MRLPRAPQYDRLPIHMQEDAREYIEDGLPPGSFLRAVLENNLVASFATADEKNRDAMFDWASWLYNDIPGYCWGSPEKVAAWIEEKADERIAR